MNRPQWITAIAGIVIVIVLFLFARTIPVKNQAASTQAGTTSAGGVSIDTILTHAKEGLTPQQLIRLNEMENSVVRGDVREQKMRAFHQLAHFWRDTAGIFLPYAWYEAEGARLENSEKSLTFAAHLFLDSLRWQSNPLLKRWEALQAKDLFERSLKINPDNDSSAVGLGATYIFGGISETPMEGIQKILEVVRKDSNNVYALMTLGQGSIMTQQYDKAIERFSSVVRIQPTNLEAILSLAESYQQIGQNTLAVDWFRKSLPLIPSSRMRTEVEKRIDQLKK